MSTNFAKEFRLFETLNSTRKPNKKYLKEARSITEILADIERHQAELQRLEQELEQAKVAKKKASYEGNFPTEVYAWDMYIDPTDKGTFCSAEQTNGIWDGIVFEDEDDAFDAGLYHLRELDTEGELSDDPDEEVEPDDYTIDVFAIPLAAVPKAVLERSGLSHLA